MTQAFESMQVAQRSEHFVQVFEVTSMKYPSRQTVQAVEVVSVQVLQLAEHAVHFLFVSIKYPSAQVSHSFALMEHFMHFVPVSPHLMQSVPSKM